MHVSNYNIIYYDSFYKPAVLLLSSSVAVYPELVEGHSSSFGLPAGQAGSLLSLPKYEPIELCGHNLSRKTTPRAETYYLIEQIKNNSLNIYSDWLIRLAIQSFIFLLRLLIHHKN